MAPGHNYGRIGFLASLLTVAAGFSEVELSNPTQSSGSDPASATDGDQQTCAVVSEEGGLTWWGVELTEPGIVTSANVISQDCDDGWAMFHDHCYYVVTQRQSRDAGLSSCQQFTGATLANVLDRDQFDFMVDLVADAGESEVWTGMMVHDAGGGTWTLSAEDGTELDQDFIDTLWDEGAGDPNQYNVEAGGTCIRLYGTQHIRDFECYRSYSAICSRPSVPGFLADDRVAVYVGTMEPPMVSTDTLGFCGRPTSDSDEVTCSVPTRGTHVYIVTDSSHLVICEVTIWVADAQSRSTFRRIGNLAMPGVQVVSSDPDTACIRSQCALSCFESERCIGFHIRLAESCSCGLLVVDYVVQEGAYDADYQLWVNLVS